MVDYSGDGRISGTTKVEGIPKEGVPVDLLHRPSGTVVASTLSGTAGAFEFLGLNSNDAFDVISRVPKKNAVISDSRKPVPTGIFVDPHRANVVALMHFNGTPGTTTPTDETGRIWTGFGPSRMSLSSEQKMFGPTSLLVNPASDRLEIGLETTFDAAMNFGSDDFTIEWHQWWRSISWPAHQAAINHGYPSGNGLNVVTGASDGKYALIVGNVELFKEATSPNLGEWYHYAVTRKNNVFNLWRNGLTTGAGYSKNPVGILGRKFAIGSYASDSGGLGQVFNGWFDELRITKGVARYTSPFDPPVREYP